MVVEVELRQRRKKRFASDLRTSEESDEAPPLRDPPLSSPENVHRATQEEDENACRSGWREGMANFLQNCLTNFLVRIPWWAIQSVPSSDIVLRAGFLYIYMQAIGLVLLGGVQFTSVLISKVAHLKHEAHVDSEESAILFFFRSLVLTYSYYAVLRVLMFLGYSFSYVGFEGYSNFPTVRKRIALTFEQLVTHRLRQATPMGHITTEDILQTLEERERDHSISHVIDASGIRWVFGREALESFLAKGRNSWFATEDATLPPVASDITTSTLAAAAEGNNSDTLRDGSEKEEEEEDEFSTPPKVKGGGALFQPTFSPVNAATTPTMGNNWPSGISLVSSPRSKTPKNLNDASPPKKIRDARLFLMVPLFWILLAQTIHAVGMLWYNVILLPVERRSCNILWRTLFEPTGRLNRGWRFVLLLSFGQWLAQFLLLFPNLFKVLMMTRIEIFVGILVLTFSGLLRLFLWFIIPNGVGEVQRFIFGVPHHIVDVGLLLAWQLFLLYSLFFLMGKKHLMKKAGFDMKRFNDDEMWEKDNLLFKYNAVIPMVLHFIRGCFFSNRLGLIHAQNDLLVISFAYPAISVMNWMLGYVALLIVKAPRRFATFLALALMIASGFWFLFRATQTPLFYAFVFIHVVRIQIVRMQAEDKRKKQVLINQAPVSPKSGAKSFYRASGRIVGMIALSYFAICTTLALATRLQDSLALTGLLGSATWEEDRDAGTFHFNHAITHLHGRFKEKKKSEDSASTNDEQGNKKNTRHTSVSRPLGKYAICRMDFHGLSAFDYALASLAPYVQDDQEKLVKAFFPEHGKVQITERVDKQKAGRMKWVELYFEDIDTTVISIQGTDILSPMDYLEDLRLWMEPCLLTVLSYAFPTVRIWPRGTTEMIVLGMHEFSAQFGLSDDNWVYTQFLELFEKEFSQEEKVVFTGHSMGGGLASVLAFLTRRPVFAMQPPGIYIMIAKHQRIYVDVHSEESFESVQEKAISASSFHDAATRNAPVLEPLVVNEHSQRTNAIDLHRDSVTIQVENDWVNNMLDDHGGLVQHVECDLASRSIFLACHMKEGTTHHLYRACHEDRFDELEWTFGFVDFWGITTRAWNGLFDTEFAKTAIRKRDQLLNRIYYESRHEVLFWKNFIDYNYYVSAIFVFVGMAYFARL